MKCKILYDFNNSGELFNDIFSSIIIFLLFVLIAFISIKLSKDSLKKVLNIFFILIFLYFTITLIYSSFNENNKLKKIYTSKEYKIIEGKIQNFKTEKVKAGYYIDSFEVNGVRFLYDSVTIFKGYHKTKYEGSLLKNELYVKIKYIPIDKRYIKNLILYLEVCTSDKKTLT